MIRFTYLDIWAWATLLLAACTQRPASNFEVNLNGEWLMGTHRQYDTTVSVPGIQTNTRQP